MKKILLILLLTSLGFGQQLKFTGSQIGLGYGRIFSGQFIEGAAEDTIYFGQACYLQSDKTSFYLADSDSLVHFNSILGIAVEDTILTGERGRFLIKGIIIDSSYSFTAEEKIFIGNSGAIEGETSFSVSGNINKDIGFALNDTTIYINTETEGYYWDDLRFPVSALRLPGTNAPAVTDYLGGQVLAFPTNADAKIYFVVQMPHSWVTGSNIEPHIHYTLSANGTNPDSVRWVFTYSWADINEQFSAPSTINVTDYVSTSVDSTQYLFDLGTLNGSALTGLSSMIICSLARDVSEDDYGGSVYLLEIDFHYLTDGKGSRQEYVK